MNPYFLLLFGGDVPDGLVNSELRVSGNNSVVDNGILFFNAYEAIQFPEVICDKKYFFLYSSDHSNSGGIIAWGKANYLDLRDFEEIGVIRTGYQCETPRLLRVPPEECEDNEVLHLFFHTNSSDPQNANAQQTRLITTSGGELHLANYTDRGNPLGLNNGENHTGYFYPYRTGVNSYIGVHLITGGVPQQYKFSTSTNGRTWTRGASYDIDSFIEAENTYIKPSYGTFFDKYGRQWWLGTMVNGSGSENLQGINKDLVLCKSENFQVTEITEIISKEWRRNYGVFLDSYSEKAAIYFEFPDPSNIYSSSYYLQNLKKYL